MPSMTQLPKKISPNEPPTMAQMTQRMRACWVCSREEPQPKFWPPTSTDAPVLIVQEAPLARVTIRRDGDA